MRGVIVFLLFSFMHSAQAITKCELSDKVIYKRGDCPEHAETLILVKGKYIKEDDLLKAQKKRDLESEKALEEMTTRKVVPVMK